MRRLNQSKAHRDTHMRKQIHMDLSAQAAHIHVYIYIYVYICISLCVSGVCVCVVHLMTSEVKDPATARVPQKTQLLVLTRGFEKHSIQFEF